MPVRLIQVKARGGECLQSAAGGLMLKTYTFYLRDGSPGERFVPALCRTDAGAMARARELLAAHSDCDAVEVFFGDRHIVTIGGKAS